jgi:tetratricopeptide (TPR) repeat protein
MATRALEIATRIDDPALIAGSRCNKAKDATDEKDFAAAHAHLAEARRQIGRLAAPASGLLVECEIAESELADAEERFEAAVDHASRGVALLEEEGNTASTRYTSALHTLARMYNDAGRYGDAVAAQRKVGEVSRRIGRGRTITMIVSLNNQGRYERMAGWLLAAERSYREAIDLASGVEGAATLSAGLMSGYARVLSGLGRPLEAKDWSRRTLEQTGAAARFLNAARFTLASVLLSEGDLAGGRQMFEHAGRELGAAPTPLDRATMAVLGAGFAVAEGRLDLARTKIAAALAADGYPGALSPLAHEMLEYAARLAVQANDHGEATRLARDAVRACEQYFGTAQPSAFTGRAHMTLGLALVAGGRTAEGQAALGRAIELIASAAGPDHPWVKEARARLGAVTRRPHL